MKKLKDIFPKDFLWGSATSAYQVEGDNIFSNWYHWEMKRIKRLIKKGKNPENYLSGKACDHYHKYPEDLRLLANSGQRAYRFSIEWSRIERKPGIFSQREIRHYRKFVEKMRSLKITPLAMLWCFTLPQWLANIGGWENPRSIDYFARYVKIISKKLSDLCDFWITFNEPNLYLIQAYFTGIWPPQKRNPISLISVEKNLILAHKRAYQIIRDNQKESKIGIANNVIDLRPALSLLPNKILCRFLDFLINFRFVDEIKNHLDFIGINYYTSFSVGFFISRQVFLKNDLGWPIYPKGIYNVIKKIWQRYKLPIIVTENGVATKEDDLRRRFIKDHLFWLKKAIEEGIDVRGYFHWGLMDNFEWHHGFWPKFGLIEIDRKDLKRKPRKSFYLYGKICQSNGSLI